AFYMSPSDYRTRLSRALALGVALFFLAVLPVFAQTTVPFSGGGKAGQDDAYAAHKYTAAPAYANYNNTAYLYGTAEDGKGYWATYDGATWSPYQAWETQPVNYKWEPAAVTYGTAQYVYYAGENGKYFQNTYDGAAWSGWQDTSGAYTYVAAPYAY